MQKFFAKLSVIRPTVVGLAVWLIASAAIGVLKLCGASLNGTTGILLKPRWVVNFNRSYDSIALGLIAFAVMLIIKRRHVAKYDERKELGRFNEVAHFWDCCTSTLGAGIIACATFIGGWFPALIVANMVIVTLGIFCGILAIKIAVPWKKVGSILTIESEISKAVSRREKQIASDNRKQPRLNQLFGDNSYIETAGSSCGILDLTRDYNDSSLGDELRDND